MTRRLTFLLGALSALCVALALPPDLLLPGARADVTCSTVAMTCSAGATFDGGTITTPILAPAASNCASVPYSFTGATDTGICSSSAGAVAMRAGGYNMIDCTNGGCANLGYFDTPSLLLSSQTYLKSDAANVLALRNSTNAQTFNIYNTYTDGSNYERAALWWSSNVFYLEQLKAGSGSDRPLILGKGFNACALRAGSQTGWYVESAAGNLLPEAIDAKTLGNATIPVKEAYVARLIAGSKTKALTEGAATAVTQIAVPQTAGANFADAVVQWTVYATDGTDTQTRRGSTYLAAVNKAGTETCTVGDIGTPVVAVSTGTLTCTTSCVTGLTDVVQFALDCTSSLTQSTLNALVRLDMDQPNTVTPQ